MGAAVGYHVAMAHTVLHLERSIDASHVIPDHPGKCARLHGHTYRFQVWISGPVDETTGMVVDFFDIKRDIDAWDHRHLNDEVDFIPTAELLAGEMRRRILARVVEAAPPGAADRCGVLLRLWETAGGFAQVGWLTRDPLAPADAVHALELQGVGAT
ncbi:MAG: Queuosine biosynthesis protein QueD [Thermoleophilia bacterium]|nr:Queuosine biosynthesis protein QueD [Thermoleophilia bacterium]